MDDIDRAIINALQDGIEITERPFQAPATVLGISEDELLVRLQQLLDDGTLSRFGPLYNADAMGGAFTLAAMSVPDQDFDRTVEAVNAFPEVAHNYRRDHRFNMWFVVATSSAQRLDEVIAVIEQKTGFPVASFPKQEEYFLRLRLGV